MDDDMEDEIICELFTTHAHIIWRYLGVTSAGLVEMVIPGPGESLKSKLFQPGPFMFTIFLIIVFSCVLQSSSSYIRKGIHQVNNVIRLDSVTEPGFKTLDLVNFGKGDGVSWEYRHGIAGVYGMQGRRGNMEDRFSVMQEVDVGDNKDISLFGVFDGHGGQYTAEYVKNYLFKNTIEKIKQLRTQPSPSNNKASTNSRKTSVTNNALNRKNSSNGTTAFSDQTSTKNKDNSDNSKKSISKEDKKNKDCDLKADGESTVGSGVENLCQPESSQLNTDNSQSIDSKAESMKKDDSYNISTQGKRKNSRGNKEANVRKESITKKPDEIKEENEDNIYIDGLKNINYSRLLKDQMMSIDKQVVENCKGNTDMSGTTAVIAILDGELLIIGNVGDSRAVMGDQKGSTIPLSFDHKPNQLKERRRIKEAGGFITFTGVWRVAGILATSRALGDFPLKEPRKLVTAEPDVLTFSLRDHKAHFVILATDGLWDVVSNEEAVAFIGSHINEPDYGAKSLSLMAYHRGSQDNITTIVLNISKLSLQ